jgi:ATP-dependent Clp protease adaptor protein ClpS
MDPGQLEKPVAPQVARRPRSAPLWHVVLLDDDDHTFDYVVEMLGELFHLDPQNGYAIAREVDAAGRAILETTVLERAEFKRDQVLAYGRDWRLVRSRGSMRAVLERAAGQDS